MAAWPPRPVTRASNCSAAAMIGPGREASVPLGSSGHTCSPKIADRPSAQPARRRSALPSCCRAQRNACLSPKNLTVWRCWRVCQLGQALFHQAVAFGEQDWSLAGARHALNMLVAEMACTEAGPLDAGRKGRPSMRTRGHPQNRTHAHGWRRALARQACSATGARGAGAAGTPAAAARRGAAPSLTITSAPAPPSSAGWKSRRTLPRRRPARAWSSRAAPSSIATCASWPHACIAPGTLLLRARAAAGRPAAAAGAALCGRARACRPPPRSRACLTTVHHAERAVAAVVARQDTCIALSTSLLCTMHDGCIFNTSMGPCGCHGRLRARRQAPSLAQADARELFCHERRCALAWEAPQVPSLLRHSRCAAARRQRGGSWQAECIRWRRRACRSVPQWSSARCARARTAAAPEQHVRQLLDRQRTHRSLGLGYPTLWYHSRT